MDNVLFGQVLMAVYGVLLIVGGVMGWVKAQSRVSLFAGAITGGLSIGAAWLSVDDPVQAFTIGSLIAFLLTGVSINRLAKTRKFMPSGMILVLSAIVGITLMMMHQDLTSGVIVEP